MRAAKLLHHLDVAHRYERQARRGRKQSKAALIGCLRLGELERYLRSRYGDQLPDDDAGRADFVIVANHLAHRPSGQLERIAKWVALWCPWMGEAFEAIAHEVQSHIEAVTSYSEKLSDDIATHLKPTKDGPSIAQQASELRAAVRAQADPMGFLHAAAVERDLETIQSVLSTSPRSSGLTLSQWELLRDEIAPENFCSKEFAALKAAKTLKREPERDFARPGASPLKL